MTKRVEKNARSLVFPNFSYFTVLFIDNNNANRIVGSEFCYGNTLYLSKEDIIGSGSKCPEI